MNAYLAEAIVAIAPPVSDAVHEYGWIPLPTLFADWRQRTRTRLMATYGPKEATRRLRPGRMTQIS